VEEPDAKKVRVRNQSCRNKFFLHKDAIKESHPHIIEWFDNSCHNSRQVQTEIIENCFKKEGKAWKLDLDKPYFKESKKRCVGSIENIYGTLGFEKFRI